MWELSVGVLRLDSSCFSLKLVACDVSLRSCRVRSLGSCRSRTLALELPLDNRRLGLCLGSFAWQKKLRDIFSLEISLGIFRFDIASLRVGVGLVAWERSLDDFRL